MRAVTYLAAAINLTVAGVLATGAEAHSGGTDASGCHAVRATGQRHCHGAREVPAPRPVPLLDRSEVYYPNCAAVRAAGAAPVRAGEPGYSRRLDRDGDGIACE